MMRRVWRRWFGRSRDVTADNRAGLRPAMLSRERRLGDAARDRAGWQEAAVCYARHLAAHPADFAIWVQLGHVRKEAGDLTGAAEAYGAALSLDAADADLLLGLGHLARLTDDLAAAALHYRRSFALDRNAAAAQALAARELRPFLAAADAIVRADAAAATLVVRPEGLAGALDPMDEGWRATGWVVDPDSEAPAEILFFQDKREVGRATAELFRPEASVGLAGFEAELDIDFSSAGEIWIKAYLKRTGAALPGSPARARAPRALRPWLTRPRSLARPSECILPATPSLSIIMPVHDTPALWLREALGSVLAQAHSAWELICVDDASPSPHVQAILAEYGAADPRIRSLRLPHNRGIAGATNYGLISTTGAYVAFMDHDDRLETDAVARMIEAAEAGADLIYSDEAVTAESTHRIAHVIARTAFSYDYYLSHPYFVHFVAVRRDLAVAIGGLDERMGISADVDFVLRAVERAGRIAHVPAVVYRWRTHGASVGHRRMGEVTEATTSAINRHLERVGRDARARPGPVFNSYRIDFADDRGKTIVILTAGHDREVLERSIASIRRTTILSDVDILVIDHACPDADLGGFLASLGHDLSVLRYKGPFHRARMSNAAARHVSDAYRYLLFCDAIEAIEPGWVEHMRGLCSRQEVAAVGATLLYPDRRVQHAGTIVDAAGVVGDPWAFAPFDDPDGGRATGYNLGLVSTRDCSAVTAACMMIRRETFLSEGGFDEAFETDLADVDLCLRLRTRGLHVLNDAHAVLYRHVADGGPEHPADVGRFRARWAASIAAGDPFDNPLLDHRSGQRHRLRFLDDESRPVRIVDGPYRSVGAP